MRLHPLLVGPGMVPEYYRKAIFDADLMLRAQEHAREADVRPYSIVGGIGVVPIVGMMAKDPWIEFCGGTSTELAQQRLDMAAADPDVGAILLRVDSGGGEVAGTEELAAAVKRARAQKSVHAHIEDVGASAALWIASQADRVTANATAMVGSYGIVATLPDTTELWSQMGVKWHYVATGDHKALTAEQPVTDKALAYVRELIEPAFQAFGAALRDGRGLSAKQLEAISDGRVYGAAEARAKGLIDAISTRSDAVGELAAKAEKVLSMSKARVRDRAMKRAAEWMDRRRSVLAAAADARRRAGR